MSRPFAGRVRTCAKINLHLAVGRRGRDGYHPVETLLQTIDWGDDLTLRTGPPGEVSLRVRGPAGIPGGEDNLVLRAARLWLAAGRRSGSTKPPGLRFELTKRLPAGAGLGGGSGDAAATLLLLEQARAPQRRGAPGPAVLRRLGALARRLGADVPFFLRGGLARGTGHGDRVRSLTSLPDHAVLVVLPPFRLGTAEVYARFDRLPRPPSAPRQGAGPAAVLRALRVGRTPLELRNDLERPVFDLHPEMEEARRRLGADGALLCGLSGSGSALFALFESAVTPRRLAEAWRARGWEAHVCGLLAGPAWRARFANPAPARRLSAGGRAG